MRSAVCRAKRPQSRLCNLGHTTGGDLALSAVRSIQEKSPAELRAWAGLRSVCRRLEVAHRFSEGRIIARALAPRLAYSRYFHATSKPNRCDPYATLQDF